MTDAKSRLPLGPFIFVDGLFLAIAFLLLRTGHRPLLWWEACLLVLCAAIGAGSLLAPFLRRNSDDQALSQVKLLAEATSQIQKLDQLAGQINGATQQWVQFQSHAAHTVDTTKAVAEKMAVEAKAFSEFLQRANDGEKAHLRLEVEKMRRGEGEWLQAVIHVLDHIFALFQAARRAGHPGLLEQIGQFQNSCRDAVRRIGILPVIIEPGETFDPQAHQLPENHAAVENGIVENTLATGYSYQGKILRRPLVTLRMATETA